MRALTSNAVKALGFVAIGVVIALAVVLPQQVSAMHEPRISYVQRGLFPYYELQCYPWHQFPSWHPCWHDDEAGTWTAIDYNTGSGSTVGGNVWLYYLGEFEHFKIVALPIGYNCTGVGAALYWQYVGNENYRRGTVRYVHINPAGGVIGDIPSAQYHLLGTVLDDEVDGCPWDGPHLHQSADTSASTPFYYNKFGDPTGEYFQEHTIYWPDIVGDADGDAFSDTTELAISSDPGDDCADTTTWFDERGFNYGEDVSPWALDLDDNRVVDIFDIALLTPPVFFECVGDPFYSPRKDFSSLAAWKVPDGCIDIFDLALMLPPMFGQTCGP